MAKRKPKWKQYPLQSRKINDSAWFYEERKGLCIVQQIRDAENNVLSIPMFYLRWPKLIRAVNNHLRIKGAR